MSGRDGSMGDEVLRAVEACGKHGAGIPLIAIRVGGSAAGAQQCLSMLVRHKKLVMRKGRYCLPRPAELPQDPDHIAAADAPAAPEPEPPPEPATAAAPALPPVVEEIVMARGKEKCGKCEQRKGKTAFRRDASVHADGLRWCRKCTDDAVLAPAAKPSRPGKVRSTAQLVDRHVATPAADGLRIEADAFVIRLPNADQIRLSAAQLDYLCETWRGMRAATPAA